MKGLFVSVGSIYFEIGEGRDDCLLMLDEDEGGVTISVEEAKQFFSECLSLLEGLGQ